MTKVQNAAKAVVAHLHAADAELRNAMRAASRVGLKLVVCDIHGSEMCLDDALFRAEQELPKKVQIALDKSARRGRMSSII